MVGHVTLRPVITPRLRAARWQRGTDDRAKASKGACTGRVQPTWPRSPPWLGWRAAPPTRPPISRRHGPPLPPPPPPPPHGHPSHPHPSVRYSPAAARPCPI